MSVVHFGGDVGQIEKSSSFERRQGRSEERTDSSEGELAVCGILGAESEREEDGEGKGGVCLQASRMKRSFYRATLKVKTHRHIRHSSLYKAR